MPAIKHYLVRQERVVRVSALNEIDAVNVASEAFDNGQDANGHLIKKQSEAWGDTESRIETAKLTVTKE
jgi:hypothetical protein